MKFILVISLFIFHFNTWASLNDQCFDLVEDIKTLNNLQMSKEISCTISVDKKRDCRKFFCKKDDIFCVPTKNFKEVLQIRDHYKALKDILQVFSEQKLLKSEKKSIIDLLATAQNFNYGPTQVFSEQVKSHCQKSPNTSFCKSFNNKIDFQKAVNTINIPFGKIIFSGENDYFKGAKDIEDIICVLEPKSDCAITDSNEYISSVNDKLRSAGKVIEMFFKDTKMQRFNKSKISLLNHFYDKRCHKDNSFQGKFFMCRANSSTGFDGLDFNPNLVNFIASNGEIITTLKEQKDKIPPNTDEVCKLLGSKDWKELITCQKLNSKHVDKKHRESMKNRENTQTHILGYRQVLDPKGKVVSVPIKRHQQIGQYDWVQIAASQSLVPWLGVGIGEFAQGRALKNALPYMEESAKIQKGFSCCYDPMSCESSFYDEFGNMNAERFGNYCIDYRSPFNQGLYYDRYGGNHADDWWGFISAANPFGSFESSNSGNNSGSFLP